MRAVTTPRRCSLFVRENWRFRRSTMRQGGRTSTAFVTGRKRRSPEVASIPSSRATRRRRRPGKPHSFMRMMSGHSSAMALATLRAPARRPWTLYASRRSLGIADSLPVTVLAALLGRAFVGDKGAGTPLERLGPTVECRDDRALPAGVHETRRGLHLGAHRSGRQPPAFKQLLGLLRRQPLDQPLSDLSVPLMH